MIGANLSRVVSLDRLDAGSGREVGLVSQQRGSTGVCRDANILENEGSEEEADLIGERIEGHTRRDDTSRDRRCGKRIREVDCRTHDSTRSECTAQEANVVQFVL